MVYSLIVFIIFCCYCCLQAIAAVCSFPDIKSAIDTTVQTLQLGIPVAKMEFVDGDSMKAYNSYSGLDFPVLPTLFMEFSGSPQSVEEQTSLVSEFDAWLLCIHVHIKGTGICSVYMCIFRVQVSVAYTCVCLGYRCLVYTCVCLGFRCV